jgi:hypothetical protein
MAKRCRNTSTASKRDFSPQQNSGTEALLSNQTRRQGNKDDADQIISTDYSITPLCDEARQ